MRIIEIARSARAAWGQRIQALEGDASYPLGNDSFRIDHGRDYFAFFERMGELRFYAAVDGDEVLAVAAAVLRRMPLLAGGTRRAWYLCDLKSRRDPRCRSVALRLLAHGFWRCYWRCPRGYAISMNPAGGGANPLVRLLRRFRFAPLGVAGSLHLFSMSPEQYRAWRPLLVEHRGAGVGLVSLAGQKDLILASSGSRMALYHVHHGSPRTAGVLVDPDALPADATCMVCAPADDALASALAARGAPLAGTATILAHRLRVADWRSIVTSEI